MKERYEVEIDASVHDKKLIAVTDAETGRRLSGTAPDHLSSQMVAILIEDHRERRFAEAVDPALAEAKSSRKEACLAEALAVFGDLNTARRWLVTPNQIFNGRRPLAVAAASDEGLAAVRVQIAEQPIPAKPVP